MGQVPYVLIGTDIGTNNGKILEPIVNLLIFVLKKDIVGISLYI